MMAGITTLHIFCRPDNRPALAWKTRLETFLRRKYPEVKLNADKPGSVVVIGGDGAILEAARLYQKLNPVILGLNMGHVGFLASVRNEKNFLPAFQRFLRGKYAVADRMMLEAEVKRGGKNVFAGYALNEIAVQNPMGIVELEVRIENYPMQFIRGSGAMVATATGSTGYNLSAHGPIVMPDIKCLILTEILDHNVPTPSIVVKHNKTVSVRVLGFRKRGLLSISKTGQSADIIFTADGETVFPLQKNDVVQIKESPHFVRFAELDEHYFFKSLQEKFGFR